MASLEEDEKGLHTVKGLLDMAIDTGAPNGRLMLNILDSLAQFEREIVLERQREAIAKALGKYKGRAPTAKAKANLVLTLHAEGIGATAIANQLNIARASVYRILAAKVSSNG